MRKILIIAWKDLTVTFRDRSALLIMLVTPIALTLAIAFAFGGLGGGDSKSSTETIPVVLVKQDAGQFGSFIIQAFEYLEMAGVVSPKTEDDPRQARLGVDQGRVTAAVIIPANFSESIFPSVLAGSNPSAVKPPEQSVVEIYADPTMPISSGIVRSIVDEILGRFIAGRVSGEVTITRLIETGVLTPQDAMIRGQLIGNRVGSQAVESDVIMVRSESSSDKEEAAFDWLKFSAPSMAILFLMFTVTSAGRTILSEREWGTLPRMLVSPTSTSQVLSGKIAGVFLTGIAQMVILYLANRLVLRIDWGNLPAVLVLIVALSAAATSWGILVAAYAKTSGQAGAMGTAITLSFAALAGNFVPRGNLPGWLQQIGYISPNAWGLDGFSRLTAGGTLSDITGVILALLLMAAVLFGFSLLAFRRQYA
jgi:ABC-2 type transport system permease protein